MASRDLVADLDAAVVRDLADDDIKVDGVPVSGMFAAPWLGPDLGHQRTQLDHPQVSVRDATRCKCAKAASLRSAEIDTASSSCNRTAPAGRCCF